MCAASKFENLCNSEEKRVSASEKKASSRENRLGLSEKCAGHCYRELFNKR